jgi:hypothetical protein
MTLELTYPDSCPPLEDTDEYTLRVIRGIKRLQELAPTIAEQKTIKDVNNIRLNCQLIQTYAMNRKLDRELVLWAQRCNLMCMRRIGEILIEMRQKKQPRAQGQAITKKVTFERDKVTEDTLPVTLEDLGLNGMEASESQAIASVSEEELEKIAEEHIKQTGQVNTRIIAAKARKRRSKKKPVIFRHKPIRESFPAYWRQEEKLLDKHFTVEALGTVAETWQKHFAEYLQKRKAIFQEQKEAWNKQSTGG